jgi:hypothetical protein
MAGVLYVRMGGNVCRIDLSLGMSLGLQLHFASCGLTVNALRASVSRRCSICSTAFTAKCPHIRLSNLAKLVGRKSQT